MTDLKTDIITQNYMRYCYYCNQAEQCDTELKCLQCWENDEDEQQLNDKDNGNLTLLFLREQYD
ncbi:hypothetical protein [uncultured Paenibacillus sp.]|uniref:hypothetical protein n=1 Tax=uncultured Paenibacillus sp. TaxID=227322 RepID=UPI0028D74DE9|nr:hypothetical protein [uncultured Paenibacillus sp.]